MTTLFTRRRLQKHDTANSQAYHTTQQCRKTRGEMDVQRDISGLIPCQFKVYKTAAVL